MTIVLSFSNVEKIFSYNECKVQLINYEVSIWDNQPIMGQDFVTYFRMVMRDQDIPV